MQIREIGSEEQSQVVQREEKGGVDRGDGKFKAETGMEKGDRQCRERRQAV